MDKESGVYIYITDNSIQTSGSQEIVSIVPMLTQKGELGLNYVTADTMKDVLGYDLDYNSNYYGLSLILSYLSYVYVWRLNQNAYLGNVYIASADASATTSLASCKTEEQLEALEGVYLAVGHKNVGNWGAYAVKINPTMQNQTQTEMTSGSFSINNVSSVEPSFSYNNVDYFGGLQIYNAEGTSLVALVKLEDTTYNVYKVSDGVVSGTSCGTMTLADNVATITLVSSISNDTFWNIQYVSNDYTEWTLTYSLYNSSDETYSVKNSYSFSTLTSSSIYYKNIDFGDIFIYLSSTIPSTNNVIRSYMTLQNGTNGDSSINATDMDTSLLKKSSANMIFMNGMSTLSVVNKIISAGATQKMHTFVDVPAFGTYAESLDWRNSITASEYAVVGAKPDMIEQTDGSYIYVYPSVYYAEIYANMLSETGTLNYPPAGYTYGTVSVTKLLDTDFANFGNQLKTNRINYMKSGSAGSCMWEQRTTYSLNSDLSYIAPTFILDALCSEMKSFEENYSFRYISGVQLLNQESGLTSILTAYVNNGFLYSYTLKVPTLAEAMASGRTVNIYAGIQIAKDSEVINLNITLNS